MGQKPNWTDENKNYLTENWGRVSLDTLCKNLNRSKNAVLIMKNRLKLGAYLDSGEYITVNQFFRAFGYVSESGYTDISWVKNRGFPVKYKRVGSNTFKIIYLTDFWNWAEKNRHKVPFNKLEKGSFGLEPAWVDGIRRKQEKTAIKYKKSPWTPADDDRLKFLLKRHKYGYAEISRKLMRTEGAISRRCIDLGLKERPVKAYNCNKWTDTEINQVFDLLRQGYTYELVSEELTNRSVKAIKGLMYRFFKTENIDAVCIRINTV